MRRLAAALLVVVATAIGSPRQPRVPSLALYREGRTALWQGNFDRAESIAVRGVTDFGSQPDWRELFSLLRADAMARRGASADALSVVDRTPVSGNGEARVRRPATIGYALVRLGKLEAAGDAFARAGAIAQGDPSLGAEVAVLALGVPWQKQDWVTTERQARDAVARGRATHQPFVVANALGMLGSAEMNREEYHDALDDLDAALALARATGARSTEMTILGNRGWCRMQLGDTEEGLSSYLEAERACEEARAPRTQPTWLANIAAVYISRSKYADALPYAQKAVAVARHIGDETKIASALGSLVDIDTALGRYADARRLNQEALALKRRVMPARIPDSMLSEARIALATGAPNDALPIVEPIIANAATAALRWDAQSVAAAAYRQLGRVADAERMYEAALASGDTVRDDPTIDVAYKLAFESNLIRVYDQYIDLLIAQRRPLDALREADRSRARVLRAGGGLTDAAFAPVDLAKRTHATILCYWLAPRRSLLWVVTANGVSLIPLPPSETIEPDVDAYVRDLASGRSSLASSNGAKLFDVLVAPAKIPPEQRVIIIPDGRLNTLNLEALILRAPARHYWIEDATVSYAPSLQFIDAPRRAARERSILIVGNVPAAGDFSALPRAGEEINRVARHFPNAVIFSGINATPEAYLNNVSKQFAFVHFVAHGTANVRTPLDSAVVLAKGRLSGRQIAGAPLDADLVTVSSCESAGKRSYDGEGLVGVAWAFLRAGARHVIAAQWDVNDHASPILMDEMYASLAAGADPAHALRAAKLKLLHSDTINERPVYWAPFILYGAA